MQVYFKKWTDGGFGFDKTAGSSGPSLEQIRRNDMYTEADLNGKQTEMLCPRCDGKLFKNAIGSQWCSQSTCHYHVRRAKDGTLKQIQCRTNNERDLVPNFNRQRAAHQKTEW